MNKVFLIGRTVRDLELKSTTSGKEYVQFDIAIDNGKDKEGNKRDATFVQCVAWEKSAEILSIYLHKGNQIAIVGEYRVEKYQNDRGENRYSHYILIKEFKFLETKPKEEHTPEEPDYLKNQTSITDEQIDDMPIQNDPFGVFDSSFEVKDDDLPF